MDTEIPPVQHRPERQMFEMEFGSGRRALIEYRQMQGSLAFTHTEVPPELEGRGIGGRLVKTALDWARDQNTSVIPACSFVLAYVRRHQEYLDLMAPAWKERAKR